MLKNLRKYFKKKRNKKNAYIINSSAIKSRPSEVFVLRKGLLYILDDKIVHIVFEGSGVELGNSSFERKYTFLSYVIIIGCLLFVPLYAFVKGAWYLGIPYALLALIASVLLTRRLHPSATPMILKHEVVSVKIKSVFLGVFFPVLHVETNDGKTQKISIGNGFFISRSEKARVNLMLLEKNYL